MAPLDGDPPRLGGQKAAQEFAVHRFALINICARKSDQRGVRSRFHEELRWAGPGQEGDAGGLPAVVAGGVFAADLSAFDEQQVAERLGAGCHLQGARRKRRLEAAEIDFPLCTDHRLAPVEPFPEKSQDKPNFPHFQCVPRRLVWCRLWEEAHSGMFQTKLIIDNRDQEAEGSATFLRHDPVGGAVVTIASAASMNDARRAADAAAAAFPSWSLTGPGERRAILLAAADRLLARSGEITSAMTAETGATDAWCRFNIELAAEILRDAAGMTTQVCGSLLPSDQGA
ncbi:MAG: aldehyde dehydrogenase family protein, partial [Rhizobium sp.]|nr:aldehyde dehydrogenase family protein [Rhizobium sp.]